MMIRHSMLALAALSDAAGAQTVLVERNPSLNAAQEAAWGALERCRKDGYQVTVTVLDRHGRAKAVVHDDGAGPHTLENSLRKTCTSITFKANSGDFGKRIGATPPPHAALVLDKVTTAEGALRIRAGNDIVGSIGVSGAPGATRMPSAPRPASTASPGASPRTRTPPPGDRSTRHGPGARQRRSSGTTQSGASPRATRSMLA